MADGQGADAGGGGGEIDLFDGRAVRDRGGEDGEANMSACGGDDEGDAGGGGQV